MSATFDEAAADPQRTIAELQRQLDACRAELAARNSEFGERIEHQSATIDVLKAMSASPGDPQPVFDLITRRAPGLCNAATASLFEFDGELVHLRSRVGTPAYRTPEATEAYRRLFPMVPTRFHQLPGDSRPADRSCARHGERTRSQRGRSQSRS